MSFADIYRAFAGFRRARMARFAALTGLTAEHTVLDVGGTPAIWESLPFRPKVTFLNTYPLAGVPEQDQIVGDGCRIPVPDKSFDIAFSNSVIEHVGSRQRQGEFAAELRRVGRRVWMQTPDRAFPLEVHTFVPLLHWLPPGAFRALAKYTSIRRPFEDRRIFDDELESLLPLGIGDVRALFPGATIIREHVLMMPKSIVAYG